MHSYKRQLNATAGITTAGVSCEYFPGKQTQYTQTRHRLFRGIWLPNEIMYAARDVTRSLVDGISPTSKKKLSVRHCSTRLDMTMHLFNSLSLTSEKVQSDRFIV